MKWKPYRESDEEKLDIKNVLKMNGVKKLPSNTFVSKYSGSMEWQKRGGYSGRKTIDAMVEQLVGAGWKDAEDGFNGISPDGSNSGSGEKFISPDGKIIFSYTCSYGSTARDNWFSFRFKVL